tara:strand:- start:217 stop:441 length:225 start_codon:yes stop_codon:yes gene_type:complete
MLETIAFGMDETALAYDMQRAHSADVWFLRARFYFWGAISTVVGFCLGHFLPLIGINMYATAWEGFWNFYHHLF